MQRTDAKKKQFIALARVSSREQEREGFSLDVQVDALAQWAERNNGELVKSWRIAETASRRDERKMFKEMLAYAKKNAPRLDGLLVYKIDRAARNLGDYMELENLERQHGVPVVAITQHTEDNPAGWMMRRTLANFATFVTEQMSHDIKEALAERVRKGWFVGPPPYGYRSVRQDGRSVVEPHPDHAPKVTRIFHLYAYRQHTVDSLIADLVREGIPYTDASPRWPRTKVYDLLRSRAYIGEISYKQGWHPGRHEPLVDRVTWDRVQAILGNAVYRAHKMVYASELIRCGHCGHLVTGEQKVKKLSTGEFREYVYYRCAKYNAAGHPRERVTEAELDFQVRALFARLRVEDEQVRDWFEQALRARTREDQAATQAKAAGIQQQLTRLRRQQDELLNLRLLGEIEAATFNAKSTELRDREAHLKLNLEACDRGRHEGEDIAVRAFELCQTLRERWLTADYPAKRRILEILLLNCTLRGVTLDVELRKPFDILDKGLGGGGSLVRRTRAELTSTGGRV